MSEVDPRIAQGIIEAAAALGVDPMALATAISYETAGTFDPTKRGPTTQWGQHQGLIQFGEPQARQYGVNWEDPIGSQLGAGGAVVRYLKEAGVRPGMGLMDIYSAINAGGVGLYDRSDANNGGAPGTVADKVNNQMGGHARNAEALLGGTFAAGPQQSPQQTPGYAPPETAQFGQQPNALATPQPTAPQLPNLQSTMIDPEAFMNRRRNPLQPVSMMPQPNALMRSPYGA